MGKVVYIIPGFDHTTDMVAYQQVNKMFAACGFRVVPVHIRWKYRVMSDYVTEFLDQTVHCENDEVCIFGFSFGAMIAFLAAQELQPQNLLLASLSPFFQEDIAGLKKSWKDVSGTRRMEDFSYYTFADLVYSIHAKTYLIAGDKEPAQLIHRVEQAHAQLENSEIYIVKGARHDLGQDEYLDIVKDVISRV